jgi:hypothetical protein
MNSVPTMLGEHGWTLVTTTTAMSGTVWCAITCLSATVFATIGDSGHTLDGTLASAVFPAGVTIYGGFTDFTLTSGSVLAYKSKA